MNVKYYIPTLTVHNQSQNVTKLTKFVVFLTLLFYFLFLGQQFPQVLTISLQKYLHRQQEAYA